MNKLKPFYIPFTGLKVGIHQFEFNIDEAFFNEFDYSPVKKGNLYVELEFNKKETMFILDFVIKGSVELICDRCNEEFYQAIHCNEKLILKFGEESIEQSEEIVVLSRSDYEINLAPYIYEFIVVSIPIVHVHPDKENGEPECNPEALEILNKLSLGNEDVDSPEVVIDPRWEALKKLRDN